MDSQFEDAKRWGTVDAPTQAPAVDYFTRSNVGPFIDTTVSVNFGMKGRIYISKETVEEMARIFGIGDTSVLERQLHDQQKYNDGYKAGLEEGKSLVAQLHRALGHLGDSGAPADSDALESARAAKDAHRDAENAVRKSAPVKRTAPGSRKARGATNKPAVVEGSNDVPDADGHGDIFRI